MFTVFKYAYQYWHTITKEELQEQVIKGGISPKQYAEITNETYDEQV
ncbi:XkdX family protein [Leuconostoc mesenteroides]